MKSGLGTRVIYCRTSSSRHVQSLALQFTARLESVADTILADKKLREVGHTLGQPVCRRMSTCTARNTTTRRPHGLPSKPGLHLSPNALELPGGSPAFLPHTDNSRPLRDRQPRPGHHHRLVHGDGEGGGRTYDDVPALVTRRTCVVCVCGLRVAAASTFVPASASAS